MVKELKQIFERYGVGALKHPDDFAQVMKEQGCSDKDIYTVMLILKCCPSVAGVMMRGEATSVEVRALVRSVVLRTGLNADAARIALGQMLGACGIKADWAPALSINARLAAAKVLPASGEEAELVNELVRQLRNEPENADTINDMDKLAEAGNAQAAYRLGCFFKEIDESMGTEEGKRYFDIAAQMGYGPAYGAQAYYLIHGKKKHFGRAARCFTNPTALSGNDGRQWAALSASLLQYRRDNIKRIKATIWMQVIALVLTILVASLASAGMIGWSVMAILLQVAGILWSLFALLFKPYNSMNISCYMLLLSWLLLMIGMF